MAAIIVEDGSGIIGANSYVSVDEFITYCELMGVVLPTVDPTDPDPIPAMLINGALYIDTFECKFPGKRTHGVEQSFSWPRKDIKYDGEDYPSNVIPMRVKLAQMNAAMFVANGGELFPSSSGQNVVEEKVGPLQTKYADPSKSWSSGLETTVGGVETLLTPLFDGGACGWTLRTVRV